MLNPEHYHSMLIERRDDGVAIVTLNRPKKLNAVDSVMHTELTRFSTDFANDDSLRALVITGAGRAFCAGGDFGPDDQVTENTDGKKLWRESRDIVDNMLSCEKPIIAAVNGYALGLGATVALLADVAVVATLNPIRRYPCQHGHWCWRWRTGDMALSDRRESRQVLPHEWRQDRR